MHRFVRTARNSLIIAWLAAMSYVVAVLMVGHWVELPRPAVRSHLQTPATTAMSDSSEWIAYHFLYAECPCSERVFRKLVSRPPIDCAVEQIVMIGDSSEWRTQAVQQGFRIESVSPEELKTRYKIESAPLLLVVDGDGLIRYSGGYTSRKQGPHIQDLSLIERTVNGESFEMLPLYGCAVSQELQELVDPLGIK